MKGTIATLSSLVLFACLCQYATFSDVLLRQQMTGEVADQTKQQPEESEEVSNGSKDSESRLKIMHRAEIGLSMVDGLFTIQELIEERVLPQPKTEEDILEIVKRLLEKLIRPNDESQYKKVEDVISRALFDMEMSGGRTNGDASEEFQKLMWLERARHLNGEIILLMEGLLGESVAGADLMNIIKENLKCNVTQISERMNRYDNLIKTGLVAFNYFALLGQMPIMEVSRRKAAFKQRNGRVVARNAELSEECFKFHTK
ncbi:hypothetical protein DAPPUDRAFT_117646 [Daphnia pulex]|uniref:Uncharacterized protein n=1 Tax=Daphnia pulex TaxID=6669 RepID=E9HTC7_DAPPU|nr:hypothetical protein DAPPUDRAFT_117646 [Daphnia pulex]|eukprot:EFX65004.1 hypothetical protein DAPPUDRAFT_117646 [Daphnia pulex]